MAVNHVLVGDEVAIDLRGDTVTAETLLSGVTAHSASGEEITGTYTAPVTSVNGMTGDVVLEAKTLTIPLPASGWAEGSITVSAEDVTADSTLVITPAPDSYLAYCEALVRCTGQGAGTLVFAAEEAPTDDLSVNVLIL